MQTLEQLKSLPKNNDFFVGIDSDGCAFDTMEIKHKECFIPNIINSWDLQAVSSLARQTAEFINLYSYWRGINRFPGLVMLSDMLAQRPEALDRGYQAPSIAPLRQWVQNASALSNSVLREQIARQNDSSLQRALAWSLAVNESVERIVRNVPPFPFVRQSLQKLQDAADVIVVSATPTEALVREWREHKIDGFVRVICGQEMGSKKEMIQCAAGGKYQPDRMLMIGDALGDLKAANASSALFYPINPGGEAASWQRFFEEAIQRFYAGTYRGAYQDALIGDFEKHLPKTPPWQTVK